MTSIQGLLVGYLLRKNLNTNISNKKHSRSRHCWQKRFFNADRLPEHISLQFRNNARRHRLSAGFLQRNNTF